jgi:type VI secretion system Hcp family effector
VSDAESITVAIYMQCKGQQSGLIKGSVTTSGYQDWIDVRSFHWEFTGSKQEGGDPTAGEVVITKPIDKASTLLVQSGLNNEVLTDVTFKFTTTVKDGVDVFVTYSLTKAHISKYEVTAEADAKTSETLKLSFQKIQQTYTGRDSKLTALAPLSVTHDVLMGKTTS